MAEVSSDKPTEGSRNGIVYGLAVLRQGGVALWRHPLPLAGLALAMSGLASVNLIAITPALDNIAASPYFQFLYATNQLLALALALYAAYKWDTALGMGAILLFLVLLVPTYWVQFLEDFPGIFHLLLVTLITLFGIWLIGGLRRALWLMRQREREISALAGLNAQVLNERVQLLEDASRGRGQLTRLLQAISPHQVADPHFTGAGSALRRAQDSALDVARTLLRPIQEVVGAEFASLALVRPDGSLGERVDSSQGLKSVTAPSPVSTLEKAVLHSWATQYIADTLNDAPANPALGDSGIRSCLGLPIKTGKRLVGILGLYSTHPHAFPEERDFLESLSSLLAGPLIRAELATNPLDILRELNLSPNAPMKVSS